MEKESSLESFGDTLTPYEIIETSFVVSAGSPTAQSLFEIGYGLSKRIDAKNSPSLLRKMFNTLDVEEIETLEQRMIALHLGSEAATELATIMMSGKNNKEFELRYQLPDAEDFDNLCKKIDEHGYETEDVFGVVETIWKNSTSLRELITSIRHISAYFDLYSQEEWWKKLDDMKKEKMISAGKEYFSSSGL